MHINLIFIGLIVSCLNTVKFKPSQFNKENLKCMKSELLKKYRIACLDFFEKEFSELDSMEYLDIDEETTTLIIVDFKLERTVRVL